MGRWFLCAFKMHYLLFHLQDQISVLSVIELFSTLFEIDLAIYFAFDVVFYGLFLFAYEYPSFSTLIVYLRKYAVYLFL